MSDLKFEDLQPVRPLLLKYLKREVSPATLWRWTKQGVRGGAKLEVVRIGIKLYTTADAVQRFADACSADLAEINEVKSKRKQKKQCEQTIPVGEFTEFLDPNHPLRKKATDADA